MSTAAKKSTAKRSPSRAGGADTHRVSFDFTPAAYQALERLVTDSASASKAEVVRRALKTFDYLLREARKGKRKLVLEDEETGDRETIPIDLL